MQKHLKIRVYGNVQGVLFRNSAKQKAKQLNIKGYINNEKNGTVFIEAEGEEKKLDKFVNWCQEGSEQALVKNIDITENSLKNYNDFKIRTNNI